jgi:hypothetical protein
LTYWQDGKPVGVPVTAPPAVLPLHADGKEPNSGKKNQ